VRLSALVLFAYRTGRSRPPDLGPFRTRSPELPLIVESGLTATTWSAPYRGNGNAPTVDVWAGRFLLGLSELVVSLTLLLHGRYVETRIISWIDVIDTPRPRPIDLHN